MLSNHTTQWMDSVLGKILNSNTNAHHIISFDTLLKRHIPDIVRMYGTLTTMVNGKKYKLSIADVISSPTKPSTGNCHEFGLNYLFCVVGTVLIEDDDGVVIAKDRFPIAHIPMMTGRSVLNLGLDPDPETFCGIFICKGKCRTIPPTKTLLFNTQILTEKSGVYTVQVRSLHTDKIFRSTSTVDIQLDDLDIPTVKLPFQNTLIHVKILVMALGQSPDMFTQIVKTIIGSKYGIIFRPFEISMENDHVDIKTQEEAVMFISNVFNKNISSTGMNILRNELFPHVGTDFFTKFKYLCVCIANLLRYKHGICSGTYRDDYAESQIITSAGHLGSMFRLLFINHMRTCGKLLRRIIHKDPKKIVLDRIYGEPRLSSRIVSAVASGAWSTLRKGVSINLVSNNTDAIDAQLRRISSTLATTNGNHSLPRNIALDQYGFVCAASSPDGDATGLIYEIALTAHISPYVEHPEYMEDILHMYLSDLFVSIDDWVLRHYDYDDRLFIYIDSLGRWLYCIADSEQFITRFRSLRRNGVISPYTFISRNDDTRTIRITLQEGILCRPLIIYNKRDISIDPNASIHHLLSTGVLEYVSPAEQRTVCKIAVTTEHVTENTTHIELTQASFLGKIASSVAFATGQQGPRLAYSTLQKKQIITGARKRYRGAPEVNQLWNTHRPLVYSKTELLSNSFQEKCRGVPVVLAIMSMPQNQEDAFIMKRGTLDRGAFSMSDNREYVSETVNPCVTKSEVFERPSDAISKKTSSYEYIGSNGLPTVGTRLPGGSVIIGKTRNVKRASLNKEESTSSTIRKCDISTCCKPGDDGTITSVNEATMPHGKRVRVVMTVTRIPSVGDKFTSQYAQKGVIGAIWNDEDMPFSIETGVSPDLIVSPLSMTSRMTMSSLLEALCGKVVGVTGNYDLGCDHQNYHQSNTILHKNLGLELKQYGFSSDGTEKYIDGRTGEMIHARIFTGIVDYYRLVHIASKKIHARSTGPRNPLTRQPRDGRRFGGGLRIGEMESSALAAHGSSYVLQERFRELSDSFEIFVCATCKLICDDVCKEIEYHFCRQCQQTNSIRSVLVPFTFLVLTLELLSTGIQVQFDVDDV